MCGNAEVPCSTDLSLRTEAEGEYDDRSATSTASTGLAGDFDA